MPTKKINNEEKIQKKSIRKNSKLTANKKTKKDINSKKLLNSRIKKISKTSKNKIKSSNKKTKSKNTSTVNPTKESLTKKFNIVEYYDLPIKYEKTVVKILFQTPNTLFVYWDISQYDRDMFNRYVWFIIFL